VPLGISLGFCAWDCTALPCPALVRRQDLGRQTQRSFTAVFSDRLEKPENES